MITPLDIQNMDFSRVMRGYKEEEVDEFLDELTRDMDALIQERDALLADKAALEAKLAETEGKLQGYKSQESAILGTLEAAKALMGDISASSEKRAQILIKNAELDAQNIRRQAEESLGVIKDEETRLIQRVSNFKSRYKSLLESELEKFDDFSDELFGIPSGPSVRKAPAEAAEVRPAAADDHTITNFRGGR